ncbi:uncharacterized protein LOC132601578 [Lycium barbarum]|uniref:uncharacterized protein LOC132601577 n=1 Tax=Lycium barbarum TaxID=112863 RepID=UPI00293EE348|nr:uncharacterized protein LOC132601577 [Lycium barbarum]XP_060170643.1 uncharacterized protein LOC132601578 [Lycium barbarum]
MRLGMNFIGYNCNGKIWYFEEDGVDVEVLMDTDQQKTIKLFLQDKGKDIITTLVYANCDAVERLLLWDNIYSLSSNMKFPWLISVDFIVIMNDEEKIGGFPIYPNEYKDFAFCMNSCELSEVEFIGSPLTWWNGRVGQDCIFKRLDRILVNQPLQDWFGTLNMDHLSRTSSDHAPLLLSTGDQVEFKKYLHFEKEFWRKKDGIQWQSKGDRNTRYIHILVKGRRKRLQLSRIENAEGEWREDDDQIAVTTIDFYQS